MNQTVRTVLMWVVILVGVLLILQVLRGVDTTSREISFSELLDRVADGQIERVLIKGDEIFIRSTEAVDESSTSPRYDLYTYNPGYDDLIGDLRSKKVEIKVEKPSDGRMLTTLLGGRRCSSWWLCGLFSSGRCRPVAPRPCPLANPRPVSSIPTRRR